MKPLKLRGYNNYDTEEASLEAGIDDGNADGKMPSRAVQSQKDEADINTIVRRFGLTGELPIQQRIPLQVDVDELLDYRTCLDRIKAAQASFDAQPASVRNRFDNDPAKFLDFFEDPANVEEGRALGLYLAAPPSSSSAPGAPPAASGGSQP